MSAQQGSINVEKINIVIIPAKSLADSYESLRRLRLKPAGIPHH
jgi:hypothetical protein